MEQQPSKSAPLSSSTVILPGGAAALGAVSGVIEVLIQQPTVAWKNALQEQRPLPFHPRELYRGLVVSAASIAPITAAAFAVNHELHQLCKSINKKDEVTDSQNIAIAAFSGFMSSFISTPTDLLIIQQQRMKVSLSSAFGVVWERKGFLGFYKGLFACSMRESLFVCGLLGVSPLLKRMFSEDFQMSASTSSMMAAVAAGVTSAVLSHPFDTVKTCQQADLGLGGSQVKCDSFLNTAKKIYHDQGKDMRVFFRGLTPRTVRIIGAVFILSECRSILHPFFIAD